jgi:DNA-binding transcriptional regulator GbsR (MarR family)
MNDDAASLPPPAPPTSAQSAGDGADAALRRSKDRFIELWAEMAAHWGVPRSMAEVHALLFVEAAPLGAEQIMTRLGISRGNASMTTRTLVEWGIVRREHRPEDRRDYFVAEQDVWTLFALVIRARKAREIDPLLALVAECKGLADRAVACGAAAGPATAVDEARALAQKLDDMRSFIQVIDAVTEHYLQADGDGLAGALRALSGDEP